MSEKMTILIGGDVSPSSGECFRFLQQKGTIWHENLQEEVDNADLICLNLETALTESSEERNKIGVHLKTSPEFAKILKNSNVGLVSLANNHIFDYEVGGVQDTIAALDKNSIQWGGVAENIDEAEKLTIVSMNGINIGFLFYAEHEFNYVDDNSWSTAVLNPSSNILRIMDAAKQCDKLIIFSHIGPEYWGYPSPRMVRLFRDFVAAGASAVINCHAHHVMGMEYYNGAPIFYGLGNLLFPANGNMPDHWYEGIIAKLEITADSIKGSPLFTDFKSLQNISLNPEANIRKQCFDDASAVLNSKDRIEEKWLAFCRSQRKHLLIQICKGIGAILPFMLSKKLFPKAQCKNNQSYFKKGIRMFRGLLMCENHVDVFARIFDDLHKR